MERAVTAAAQLGQFTGLLSRTSRAELHTRLAWAAAVAGRSSTASPVDEAVRVGEPYATGRNLGLRLVAEAAINDGWGSPVEWLRTSEEYFHSCV